MESGPLALRQAKHAIRMGADRSLEDGLQLEIDAYKALLPSRDRQEGLKAFVEKRKPNYRGE
jgi:enoyl-CoA hydratase/carnithine racemase